MPDTTAPADDDPSPISDAEDVIDEFHAPSRRKYRLGEATQQTRASAN